MSANLVPAANNVIGTSKLAALNSILCASKRGVVNHTCPADIGVLITDNVISITEVIDGLIICERDTDLVPTTDKPSFNNENNITLMWPRERVTTIKLDSTVLQEYVSQ